MEHEYQWNCLNIYLVTKRIMCGMTIVRYYLRSCNRLQLITNNPKPA